MDHSRIYSSFSVPPSRITHLPNIGDFIIYNISELIREGGASFSEPIFKISDILREVFLYTWNTQH